MARRILPDSILAKLDNPGPEHHDKLDLQHSGSPDSIPPKPNPYRTAMKAVLSRFKPLWKKMGRGMRWMARKILPENLLKLLDNPSPEFHDLEDTPITGEPASPGQIPNPYKTTQSILLKAYRVVWRNLPPALKFIAKAVLPTGIYDMLEQVGGGGKGDDLFAKGTTNIASGVDNISSGLSQSTQILIAARKRLVDNTRKFANELNKTQHGYSAGMGNLVAIQTQMLRELKTGSIKQALDEIYNVLNERLTGQSSAVNIPVMGGRGASPRGPNAINTQRAQNRSYA